MNHRITFLKILNHLFETAAMRLEHMLEDGYAKWVGKAEQVQQRRGR